MVSKIAPKKSPVTGAMISVVASEIVFLNTQANKNAAIKLVTGSTSAKRYITAPAGNKDHNRRINPSEVPLRRVTSATTAAPTQKNKDVPVLSTATNNAVALLRIANSANERI
jgi:hypothetical protein